MEIVRESLKTRWEELLVAQPNTRIRNAATTLGVSEVELLATRIGEGVTRLKPDFIAILMQVEALGKVMALTRNDEVVHERKGVYLNGSLDNPHVGLFVGEDIDLRIFFQTWAHAFAVDEGTGKQRRQSLQFFAKNGEAIHKIYLTSKSDKEAYLQLVLEFQHPEPKTPLMIEELSQAEPEQPDSAIDSAAFQDAWRNLKDTHHFFGLLKKFKLTRTQALRLAPEGNFAVPVSNQALRKVLDLAAFWEQHIMVFVGNPGMIQIHTGPVKKLLEHGTWYNVMDPDFNLHVQEPSIAQSWIVRKPTEDGMVTALECFNEKGQQVAQFFGKRKPGIPEQESWRALIADLERELRLQP